MRHLRKFEIETIPHRNQRYETIGDYWEQKYGVTQVRISRMKNVDFEFLVLIHELIEYHLVKKAGIKIEDIDVFDIQFEKDRELGLHVLGEEPGNSPAAPYHKQHMTASVIERLLAEEMGIDWVLYEKTVMEL